MKNLNPRTTSGLIRLANCAERARELRNSPAYSFRPFFTDPNAFYVFKNEQCAYLTNVARWECNCPDFTKNGDYCKHLLCAEEIARENAQVAAYEATDEAKWDALFAQHGL